METADPIKPSTPAWCTFLHQMNLQLPALIDLVC